MLDEQNLVEALRAIVGASNVLVTVEDCEPYLFDWKKRYRGDAACVVRPADTAQVAAVVRLCAAAGVPITPQGGNTGLCGGATPLAGSRCVVLRLDRMNRVRDLSRTDGSMVVEAGCVLADVQRAAAEVGRLFPLSLGAEGSCQVGGVVSTNAGGVAVLRYGPMRSLVLGLEVVLPDGQVLDCLRTLRKDNTGYDLKQLFIGAEGTLGIVTAAALALHPLPEQRFVAFVALGSVGDALALLELLLDEVGERVSSFELMSANCARGIVAHIPGMSMPLDTSQPWFVLVEIGDTASANELRERAVGALEKAMERGLVADAAIAESDEQAARLWRLRHSVAEAFRHAGVGISFDTSVPLLRQPEFVAQCRARIATACPEAEVWFVGHVGDGNIHVMPMLDRQAASSRSGGAFEAFAARLSDVVDEVTRELGGSISAEHGIGFSNRRRLAASKSAIELALMRTIKRAIDPRDLMNPGKIFE